MKKNKRIKFNKYLDKKRFRKKKYLHKNNLKFKINSKANKLLFIFFLSFYSNYFKYTDKEEFY